MGKGNGTYYDGGGSGGGATHIATTNRGVLSNYQSYKSDILIVAGGGGGGWYGGYASQNTGVDSDESGGGGSGYIGNTNLINKSMYCYGCKESNDESTKTISTTGSSSERNTTNCPNGYSNNPISKCAKTGNGYAKITYIGVTLN